MSDAEGQPILLQRIESKRFYSASDSDSWWQQRQRARRRTQPSGSASGLLWLEFARQANAFSAADAMPRVDVTVFSYQPLDKRAAQRYVVSTVDDFWLKYATMPASQKTFFELIRDNHVCNLYFDIEFKWIEHPDIATPTAARRLVLALKTHAASLLQTDVNCFVDLESLSDEKYSCHLVLRSPHVCFRSAVECGVWVKRMLLDVPELEFMIDPSVYTKNRLFRIAFSSKIGRNSPLVLAPASQGRFATDEAVFRASLVTSVLALSKPVHVDGVAVASTSVASRSASAAPPPPSAPPSKSPFPTIDQFIAKCHLVQPNGGFLRSSLYFPSTRVLVFEVAGNRFCHRILRQHKSNHIYIVVELLRMVYSQRCHDYECASFRSNEFALPASLDPFDGQDEITDAELLDFIEQQQQAGAPV
jgi:hypothetical protein